MGGYFDYWGKASAPAEPAAFHRLVYHCLDVAAVGEVLLARVPAHLKKLATLSGFTAASLRSVLPYQLALHDLGKFAEPFQDQKPEFVARLQGARAPRRGAVRHDTLGYLLWKEWSGSKTPEHERELLGASCAMTVAGELVGRTDLGYVAQAWMAAVLGHHGRPPEERPLQPPTFAKGARSRGDAAVFLRDLHEFFHPEQLASMDDDLDRIETKMRRASWWLAGFTIVCDWLGSNAEYFTYEQAELSLETYWARAQRQAQDAVRASGLGASAPLPFTKMGALLPAHVAEHPSPLQAAAADVELEDGPQLHVLEDLTGSGKTEAALVLAHRLMTEGRGSGLYFALPTMATANAMAPRVAGLVGKLFSGKPSFLLTHSGPRLTEQDYLRLAGQVVEASPEPDQPAGSTAASAWLADRRKKALLAELGVGTIDQALLAILQSRHAAVRLFGLQQHVLIVDEVHACDPYMVRVLAALLRAHAALGGSAILLSATLPLRQRQELVAAFAGGLGSKPLTLHSEAFPLLTSVGAGDVREQSVEPRADSSRELPLRWYDSGASVVDRLIEASQQGQCACWIRNSVADALEAFDLLAARLPEGDLTLFHARFPLGDRLAIEQRVVDRFGPRGEGRRGHVVIATQVVEQSLDVDFDVLVTDLCPIDRVIQRAGRLQRHHALHAERPAPVLEILAPPWAEDPPAVWLSGPFRRTAVVYADPGVLWRTMAVLRDHEVLSTPRRARSLIEAVFGEGGRRIPEGLTARSDAADGKRIADGSLAQTAVLKLDLGYLREGADWSDEARTPTRLGEPTTTLRLARLGPGGEPVPWNDRVPAHAWALSQVSVARRLVAKATPADAALVERHASGPRLDDDVVTVLLHLDEGDTWAGEAIAERSSKGGTRDVSVRLVYSEKRGLGVTYLEGK